MAASDSTTTSKTVPQMKQQIRDDIHTIITKLNDIVDYIENTELHSIIEDCAVTIAFINESVGRLEDNVYAATDVD